jgi:hypothetical protein
MVLYSERALTELALDYACSKWLDKCFICGRAFKTTPSIPFVSTSHHRSALAVVSCTLQVMSYGHGSRAKQ